MHSVPEVNSKGFPKIVSGQQEWIPILFAYQG